MAYTIQWVVPNRVLYSEFHGVISGDELRSFLQDISTQMEAGTPMVHHISNSLDLERVTFSLGAARGMSMAFQLTKMMGWQVDINENKVNRMFADIMSQFAGVRSRTVLTYKDAFEFLVYVDVTLEGLEWTHPEGLMVGTSEDGRS